ncbi:phage major capsid protein [Rossellomorea aquimaris]|uniref:Phage major capsid protein n=1 Tax=Rossellomorea aquimaris TaxID=189382 RepID=A0A5D4UGW2_9BACI|nr:phage major capsid protein [Rossellomorea aquimaris]TYS77594.1 phage major capsid protein [Rossellomorea aquimaris]TYS86775.1 phage major capsid protein [Rossellomorea aquimaris]
MGTNLLKLDLQYFAQTFSPDNVMVHEAKDGTIPDKYNTMILNDVMENSKIMQLGVYEEMTDKEKTFEYFAEGPGAYWVGETEKIQTSKPTLLQVKMTAKKLGVILPVSREYLQYRVSNFFEIMRPKIAQAFYKKFDEAGILNVANPFTQSIEQSVIAAENIVYDGITYDNILAVEDELFENDVEPNAWISKVQNHTALRNAQKAENGTLQSLYDRSNNTIDGLPAVDLKTANLAKGTLYAGDFDQLRYGIPFNIDYAISEEAQLSTITNADGSPINLFEQEMVALRATMDVGLMIIKDEAFAKLTPDAPPVG